MLRWILLAFAVALLVSAVALAFDGRFGVALAISWFLVARGSIER